MYEFTVRPTPQGYVAVTITPTMDGRKRPGRVYAFSCNEARTLSVSFIWRCARRRLSRARRSG